MMLVGCGDDTPLTEQRYASPDSRFAQMDANLASTKSLKKVIEIDHSRLGMEEGSAMPPARVLIFSDPELETKLIEQAPLSALDLPLRILAYESEIMAPANVIFNRFDYFVSRYGITSELKPLFDKSMNSILKGIPSDQIVEFSNNDMQPDGIITMPSPYDFPTTMERVQAAIASQGDTVGFGTVGFGTVDFKAQAETLGVSINPMTMILFGGPAPGAKAMSKAPTPGLDAFCQKFLVWQDEKGNVSLSFNDLLALADRQGVRKAPVLRIINLRLKKTFSTALEE